MVILNDWIKVLERGSSGLGAVQLSIVFLVDVGGG